MDTPYEIAELFNSYFQSVFINDNNRDNYPPCQYFTDNILNNINITSNEVLNLLKSIDVTKSSGPDDIPGSILVKCATELSTPLTILLNTSLRTGVFPTYFKYANITPVLKSGDRSLAKNYRPISLLNLFSKVFEVIIHNNLFEHIKHVISDCQHGFFAGRSTATNLICYLDRISGEISGGRQVDSIYLDFKKAFDSVSHPLLLYKLRFYGITGPLYNWFESYLTARKQRVVINGQASRWCSVTSGVPQGSILGPALFIMYINDIVNCINHSCISLYADDSKIFHPIKSASSCKQLQSDLNCIITWCKIWKLNLNLDKCQIISFTNKKSSIKLVYRIGRVPIKRVSAVRDLGIYLTSNLSFNTHINLIVNQAFKMLGFLKRTCKPFSNINALKLLCVSYVRSQLDYCSQIWSPHQNYLIIKLERVQKRFIKFLCVRAGIGYISSQYANICKHFGIQTLKHRRDISDLCFLHKCLNNIYNCSYIVSVIPFHAPSRHFRAFQYFRCPNSRINIRQYSFIPRACSLLNNIFMVCPELDLFSRASIFKSKHVSHFNNY